MTSLLFPVGLLTSISTTLEVTAGAGGMMVVVPSVAAGVAGFGSRWTSHLSPRLVVAVLVGLAGLAGLACAIAQDFSSLLAIRVLADGWSFASWVVGASHIRAVDADWPKVGTAIHHSVGVWPFLLQDKTVVRAFEPGTLLELDARLFPVGRARVRLEVSADGPGRTTVRLAEMIVSGPAGLAPAQAQALFLRPRNEESLQRLANIAIGKQRAGN